MLISAPCTVCASLCLYIYIYIYVYSLYFILVIGTLPFCGNPIFYHSFQSLPFAGTLLAASYDPGEQSGIKHLCAGEPQLVHQLFTAWSQGFLNCTTLFAASPQDVIYLYKNC